MCSACDDEENAPVATTVHREGDSENSHAATLLQRQLATH